MLEKKDSFGILFVNWSFTAKESVFHMKNCIILLCTVCAIALHGFAADKYYLIKTEKSNTYADPLEFAFVNPEKWKLNGGEVKDSFDDTADYIFRFSQIRVVVKNGSDKTFQGGRLIVGEGKNHGALLLYNHSPYVTTFGNQGLKLVHGSILSAASDTYTYYTDGKIEVDTVAGGYAYILCNNEGDVISHRGTLTVVDGKQLDIGMSYSGIGGGRRFTTFELTSPDSCLDVKGTVSVHSWSNIVHGVRFYDQCDTTFAVARTEFPGTLNIGTNCCLKVLNGSDVFKVKTLCLADNSWIDVSYEAEQDKVARIEVDSSLQVDGVVNVRIPEAVSGNIRKFAILKMPSNSGVSMRNFKVKSSVLCYWLSLEETEECTVLYANYPDVRQNVKSAVLGESESWSDNTTANQAGFNYALEKDAYEGGGYSALTMPENGEDYAFDGDSLTIGYGCRLRWSYKSYTAPIFTCKVLRIINGGYLDGEIQCPLVIRGGIVDFPSGSVGVGVSNKRTLTFDSEITGHADVRLEGITAKGTTSVPHGYYEFNALNTQFYGRIFLRQSHCEASDGTVYIGFDASCTLDITDGRSLGGNLFALEPKALLLARYGLLNVKGNTTLAAESNRGIYIEDIGRIAVLNNKSNPYTFRMETPLAINGTFYKEGIGTLELAGSMAFGEDGLAETPTEGSNGFVVTGGVVRVCSAGAIDGCKMELRDGASLELAVDFENEELMAQGIRNVKTDTPFDLGEGVEKLPLSLKFVAGVTAPSTKFTVPLLTVSANAADSVRDMLPAIKMPFKSYQATLKEISDSETGNVTFAYELKYQALKVIVR